MVMVNRFEVVATNDQEIKEAQRLYASYQFEFMYVLPEMVNAAAMARIMSNGKFKIFAMVDYPRGIKTGIDKFHGTSTDFFMADGFDVVMGKISDVSAIWNEVHLISKFIRDMVNPVSDVCLTINRSSITNNELMQYAMAIHRHPVDKLKIESLTRLQPTKANFKTHSEATSIIRPHCQTPITLCGNINKKIYNEIEGCNLAVSPQQLKDILDSLMSKNESELS